MNRSASGSDGHKQQTSNGRNRDIETVDSQSSTQTGYTEITWHQRRTTTDKAGRETVTEDTVTIKTENKEAPTWFDRIKRAVHTGKSPDAIKSGHQGAISDKSDSDDN